MKRKKKRKKKIIAPSFYLGPLYFVLHLLFKNYLCSTFVTLNQTLCIYNIRVVVLMIP